MRECELLKSQVLLLKIIFLDYIVCLSVTSEKREWGRKLEGQVGVCIQGVSEGENAMGQCFLLFLLRAPTHTIMDVCLPTHHLRVFACVDACVCPPACLLCVHAC